MELKFRSPNPEPPQVVWFAPPQRLRNDLRGYRLLCVVLGCALTTKTIMRICDLFLKNRNVC